ncbi:MAG TPA: hypothetical protein VK985_16455 [Rariglobus sp.]|nr:hypothetical protein [Rariglobus sp.]
MALSQRHLMRAVFSLLLLTAIGARAQTPPAPEPPPPQFRVVTMSGVETFLFDVEKKQELLTPGIGSFSRLYPSPKNREIVFYTMIANPDPKLPPAKVAVAKAQLPPQKPGPFLILLNKNPAGAELKFSTLVIDNSLDAYPINTYRVFNFSKRRLAANVAGIKMVLATGQNENAPYPSSRKAWIQIAADEKDAGWLLVSSSPQPVGANSRTSIFLVDIDPSERDPNPKGIVARRIRETIVTDDKGVQHVQ